MKEKKLRHEWYSEDIESADAFIGVDGDQLIGFSFEEPTIATMFDKGDVVAMAKVFGLAVYDEDSKL